MLINDVILTREAHFHCRTDNKGAVMENEEIDITDYWNVNLDLVAN